MLEKVVTKSPAKLNLHLKVHPKRADGYHDIESIFQAISLFDELTVTTLNTQNSCTVNSAIIELPLENTVTVAYKEYCTYTGIKTGVHVQLSKQIFSGAGLGGGSSNGAALISALDTLFDTRLTIEEKVMLALKVGSDVPFFVHGGAAIVTGRGDFIQTINPREDLYFLVIMPDIHSSTKKAFQLLDEYYDCNKSCSFLDLLELQSTYNKPVVEWTFDNSFTSVLTQAYPIIRQALDSIVSCKADYAQMSGSGAAVYGVFEDEVRAKEAYAQLCMKWTCRLARAYVYND